METQWGAPLEREFRAQYALKSLRLVRFALLAGMVLCLPFGFGIGIPPESLGAVRLAIFGVTLPLLAICFWLTWSPWFPAASQGVSLVVSLGIAALTVFTNLNYKEPDYTYRTAFALIVVLGIMFLLGRLFLRTAVLGSVMAIAGTLWLSMALKPMGEANRGLVLAWIVIVCTAGCVSAWMQERYARNEFNLQRLLDIEKRKSEEVLFNVLPAPIASRLREKQELIADQVEDASVLFCDIVGFTPFAASRSAEEAVGLLNSVFSSFDNLVEEHRLEKIKTVGDALMVAGGVLGTDSDHLSRMARLALALREESGKQGWEVRIGLHCGPLVAGVIGSKKLLFDLWGATVNLASRLESHGIPNEIQVSEAVRAQLADRFEFGPAMEIEVKGVGPCSTYLLISER